MILDDVLCNRIVKRLQAKVAFQERRKVSIQKEIERWEKRKKEAEGEIKVLGEIIAQCHPGIVVTEGESIMDAIVRGLD